MSGADENTGCANLATPGRNINENAYIIQGHNATGVPQARAWDGKCKVYSKPVQKASCQKAPPHQVPN